MRSFASKEDILICVKILDIAEEFGIIVEEASSGNFTHRCSCPSPNHKNGAERTPSLFIDAANNNFYCFGCSASSNSIDFYMACSGDSFVDAISALRERVEPGCADSRVVLEGNNFNTLLKISFLFRETMLNHKEDLKWINDLMKYSDRFILSIHHTNEDGAKRLLSNIQEQIRRRYQK